MLEINKNIQPSLSREKKKFMLAAPLVVNVRQLQAKSESESHFTNCWDVGKKGKKSLHFF